jgi:chromosome segregation ATPase
MKNKARELANNQAREIHELEIKQKEMKINVEVASKNMQDLKRRHEQEKNALNSNQAQLEKLRAEAKQARELAEKHDTERAQLEKRIRELDQQARQERQNADLLLGEHENLKDGKYLISNLVEK